MPGLRLQVSDFRLEISDFRCLSSVRCCGCTAPANPRLEPGRCSSARSRHAGRRDAAGRAAVAFRADAHHRPEDRHPSANGRARNRHRKHRPSGCRTAGRRRRRASRAGDWRAPPEDPAELRGAHRDGRYQADRRDFPAGRDRDRMLRIYRVESDQAAHGRVDPRISAEDDRGRDRVRRSRRVEGVVRHGGHDTRRSCDRSGRSSRPRSDPARRGCASPIRSAMPRRRAPARSCVM